MIRKNGISGVKEVIILRVKPASFLIFPLKPSDHQAGVPAVAGLGTQHSAPGPFESLTSGLLTQNAVFF